MTKEFDFNYQRSEYIAFSPMDAKKIKKLEDQLLADKLKIESQKSGQPTRTKTKTTISSDKRMRILRNFKKNGNIPLKQFVSAFQKELRYASYEKVFYKVKQADILLLLMNKGFVKCTESVILENIWERKTRKRYYIEYKNHEKFIEYLNKYIIPFKAKKYNKSKKK